MSRLPWSFWLGSSTSPLAMTMSNLSAGSAGLKPRGAGWAAAWATSVGAWAPAPGVCPASVAPAAAAAVEGRKFRRVASIPGRLARHAGAAVEQDGDGDLAGRADREALGRVTDDHPIDDARWIRLKVDDTHRVHVTVGGPAVAVVGGEGELAVRRDVDVVRPEPGRH